MATVTSRNNAARYDLGSARVTAKIIDLDTRDELELMLVPSPITEKIEADWSRQAVVGLSHRRKQYVSTDDKEMSFTAQFDGAKIGSDRVIAAKAFLESMCYPTARGAEEKRNYASPSAYLFMVPNSYSVRVRVATVTITAERFYSDGKLRSFSAELVMYEEMERRTTSDMKRKEVRKTLSFKPTNRR